MSSQPDRLQSTDEPVAFLNGALLPFSSVRLPVYDAGFVQGAIVTDFVRTFRQKLYLLPEHLARFETSCRLAEIPLQPKISDLAVIAEDLVARNGRLVDSGQELALILAATPGPIAFYASGHPASGEPTLVLHTVSLDLSRYTSYFKLGASLVTPAVHALPRTCLDPHIKHRSRLHWRLAQREVDRTDPGAAALLLDAHGHITETAAANLLLVREGVVTSPSLETVLPGISLQVVRELCAELTIPFREANLTLKDCTTAQEAFLTNTTFCLAGVRRINGFDLPWPGPITRTLLDAWSQRVGIDIAGQLLAAM